MGLRNMGWRYRPMKKRADIMDDIDGWAMGKDVKMKKELDELEALTRKRSALEKSVAEYATYTTTTTGKELGRVMCPTVTPATTGPCIEPSGYGYNNQSETRRLETLEATVVRLLERVGALEKELEEVRVFI